MGQVNTSNVFYNAPEKGRYRHSTPNKISIYNHNNKCMALKSHLGMLRTKQGYRAQRTTEFRSSRNSLQFSVELTKRTTVLLLPSINKANKTGD